MYPPNQLHDYFVIINDELITISGMSKASKCPVLLLKSLQEYEMELIDRSLLRGYIIEIDLDTGAITLGSSIKKWTFNPEKIKKLYLPVIKVKIILRDGSFRIGELESDTGKTIEIKTMFGTEQFDRSIILKIEYIKK